MFVRSAEHFRIRNHLTIDSHDQPGMWAAIHWSCYYFFSFIVVGIEAVVIFAAVVPLWFSRVILTTRGYHWINDYGITNKNAAGKTASLTTITAQFGAHISCPSFIVTRIVSLWQSERKMSDYTRTLHRRTFFYGLIRVLWLGYLSEWMLEYVCVNSPHIRWSSFENNPINLSTFWNCYLYSQPT